MNAIHKDAEGWWWFSCFRCGLDAGPFPGRDEATDEALDHRTLDECGVEL